MAHSVLRIDASANTTNSITRSLTDQIIARLGNPNVQTRDLATSRLPQVDEAWINARAKPQDQRSEAEQETLALSDELVSELVAADTVVIGMPVYNFSIPASLKAWIDLIARVGVTFRYTENGPEGLLTGKKAIIAMASGGVPVGSDADFASDYLKFVLAFVGITDVRIVAADQIAIDQNASLENAQTQIRALAA